MKDKYPISLITEILDHLSHTTVFTKLDLRGAYNLIQIQEGNEWKTAFCTQYGSFEFQVMPFSLANAPSTFQSYIDHALQQFLDRFIIVYLNDILIYSVDHATHSDQIQQVLQALWEHSLYTKLDKCAFSQDSVEYLGFLVSPQGLGMDPAQITTVTEWLTLMSVKEVQSFLGFCNFYWWFIVHYSKVALPLTELTRKTSPYEWNESA